MTKKQIKDKKIKLGRSAISNHSKIGKSSKKRTAGTVRGSAKRQLAIEKGFRSYFELQLADKLTNAGILFEYEKHKLPYTLKETNCTCKTCGGHEVYSDHIYLPDFYLPEYDVFLEPKGVFDAAGRQKMKAIQIQHLDKSVYMVFQAPNKKISPKSKYNYTTWSEANGLLTMNFKSVVQIIKNSLRIKK